ncbi:MAG: MDR/zinc-dependent alcohol dehydrogenase-like family protein [Thermoproteus sp.]
MRALLLKAPRELEVVDLPTPEPPAGWSLVRTELAGICGTDKAFYRGTYPLFKRPLVPGHEVVGTVVEGPLKGRRVVSEINFADLTCDYCRSGLYTHCPYKKTLGIDFDGGMAEYFVAPDYALHLFDGPPELGIFVEPLAAVLNAFSLRPLRPGERAAVVGVGNMALLAVQVLRLLGASEVAVVARRESRRLKALERLADVVYLGEAPGARFDLVFEASGDPKALDAAVAMAKPRGAVHLKSTPGSPAVFNSTLAVVKEVAIVGSRCGTFREFREAIALLTSGKVRPVLDAVYPLEEGRRAFEEAQGDVFKVAVRP